MGACLGIIHSYDFYWEKSVGLILFLTVFWDVWFYLSRKYIPGIQPRQRTAEETTKGKIKRDCQSAESKRGEFN